jgi:hypothetical protein
MHTFPAAFLAADPLGDAFSGIGIVLGTIFVILALNVLVRVLILQKLKHLRAVLRVNKIKTNAPDLLKLSDALSQANHDLSDIKYFICDYYINNPAPGAEEAIARAKSCLEEGEAFFTQGNFEDARLCARKGLEELETCNLAMKNAVGMVAAYRERQRRNPRPDR